MRMNTSTIYAIDFGLSKRYKDSKTLQHCRFRQNKSLTGTARYASINAHLGYELSRRDDLEGLAYVLIYFLKGSLPWQGLPGANKEEKYMNISQLKISSKPSTLCAGLPTKIEEYLSYCRSLKFDQTPDYELLKTMLRDVYEENEYEIDGIFDWDAVDVIA